jgi:hypothetical protein
VSASLFCCCAFGRHAIHPPLVHGHFPPHLLHYLNKAQKKGRTQAEVDTIFRWLTGYTQKGLEAQLENQATFESFFKDAPALNPSRALIKGTICGVRIEEIKEPLMREIRYLDKLIDELAKGKAMEKILRA